MSKLKCWKKNEKSGYPARWDKKGSSHVVVVNDVHRVKSRNPFKLSRKMNLEMIK